MNTRPNFDLLRKIGWKIWSVLFLFCVVLPFLFFFAIWMRLMIYSSFVPIVGILGTALVFEISRRTLKGFRYFKSAVFLLTCYGTIFFVLVPAISTYLRQEFPIAWKSAQKNKQWKEAKLAIKLNPEIDPQTMLRVEEAIQMGTDIQAQGLLKQIKILNDDLQNGKVSRMEHRQAINKLLEEWESIKSGELPPAQDDNTHEEISNPPQRIETLSVNRLHSVEFFDPVSGEAKVFFHKRTTGEIELFDKDGYHPQLQERLLPITPEIVQELLEKAYANEKAIQETRAKEVAHLKTLGEQAERRAFLNRYTDTLVVNVPERKEVAILVVGEPKLSDDIQSVVSNCVNSHSMQSFLGVLKGTFIGDGYFEQLYSGETSVIHELDLSQRTDYVMLGKASSSITQSIAEVKDLLTVQLNITLRIYRTSPPRILSTENIQVHGAGFSEDQARVQAVELFEHEVREYLSAIQF